MVRQFRRVYWFQQKLMNVFSPAEEVFTIRLVFSLKHVLAGNYVFFCRESPQNIYKGSCCKLKIWERHK